MIGLWQQYSVGLEIYDGRLMGGIKLKSKEYGYGQVTGLGLGEAYDKDKGNIYIG